MQELYIPIEEKLLTAIEIADEIHKYSMNSENLPFFVHFSEKHTSIFVTFSTDGNPARALLALLKMTELVGCCTFRVEIFLKEIRLIAS